MKEKDIKRVMMYCCHDYKSRSAIQIRVLRDELKAIRVFDNAIVIIFIENGYF